jgi:hypothetical protein
MLADTVCRDLRQVATLGDVANPLAETTIGLASFGETVGAVVGERMVCVADRLDPLGYPLLQRGRVAEEDLERVLIQGRNAALVGC